MMVSGDLGTFVTPSSVGLFQSDWGGSRLRLETSSAQLTHTWSLVQVWKGSAEKISFPEGYARPRIPEVHGFSRIPPCDWRVGDEQGY